MPEAINGGSRAEAYLARYERSFWLRAGLGWVTPYEAMTLVALQRSISVIGLGFGAASCGLFGVDFSEPPSRPNERQDGSEPGPDGGVGFAPEGSGVNGRCAAGEKVCEATCVSLRDPAVGCGAPTCEPCSVQSGAAICMAGACAVSSCVAPSADCDGNVQNGCETQTQTSRAHCGTCGNACAKGQVCSAGACSSSCSAGLTQCMDSCVNLGADATHCGGCNTVCPAPVNGRGTCTAAKCGTECSIGFRACPGNTCQAESVQACGASCQRCAGPSSGVGVPRCVSGSCTVQCSAGYVSCAAGCCLDAPSNACAADQERLNEVLVDGFIKQGFIMPSRCSLCTGAECCFRRRADGKDYCISR